MAAQDLLIAGDEADDCLGEILALRRAVVGEKSQAVHRGKLRHFLQGCREFVRLEEFRADEHQPIAGILLGNGGMNHLDLPLLKRRRRQVTTGMRT